MERSPVKLYNESGGELDQVKGRGWIEWINSYWHLTHTDLSASKVLYSASQRRVQELTVENENIKADTVTRCQELKHKAEMKQDQLDEQDAKMAQLRSELEQSENRAFALDKKLTSFENANTNLAQQNSDFEKRQILQIAEIESLENELRIASSEDVIQKANMANRRKLDESRVQHKDETDRLKVMLIIDWVAWQTTSEHNLRVETNQRAAETRQRNDWRGQVSNWEAHESRAPWKWRNHK